MFPSTDDTKDDKFVDEFSNFNYWKIENKEYNLEQLIK